MSERDEGRPDAAEVVRLGARAFERDRYLSALLAPRAVRDDLVALAAFAGEIGRIPAMVSEPMVGQIRLQWWRDAIGGGARATGNPVADALSAAVGRHGLPLALIHDAIDAVEDRLDDQPFADLAAMTANAGRLEGTLFRLAHFILARERRDPSLLAAAGEIYGLARALIEAPAELAQGRVLLPRDMIGSHGLSPGAVRNAATDGAWRALSDQFGVHVQKGLREIVPSFQRAPADVRAAVLPIALVRPYLKASQRVDIASLEVGDVGPLTRVWRLWMAHRFAAI